MIDKKTLKRFGIELKPCKTCGGEVEMEATKYSSFAGSFNDYYTIVIKCNQCKKHFERTIDSNYLVSDDIQIRNVIRQWNEENDISSELDLKLIGFDDNQTTFVCILLYLAGYKFTKEEFSKYIKNDMTIARETFKTMTQKQKSKLFVMLGETLGYLPKGEND